MSDYVTREELATLVNVLVDRVEKRIDTGFQNQDTRLSELVERMDILNGRTRRNEVDIAVLKTVQETQKQEGRRSSIKLASITSGAITILYVIAEAIRQVFFASGAKPPTP